MADEHETEAHADHHGHPELPDESKLWDDHAHGAVAHDVARMWFVVTALGALAYIAVVIVWIFL